MQTSLGHEGLGREGLEHKGLGCEELGHEGLGNAFGRGERTGQLPAFLKIKLQM